MTAACMGGFCGKRNGCEHYRAEDRSEPSERLCVPGADGIGRDVQVVFSMRAVRPELEEEKNNGTQTR